MNLSASYTKQTRPHTNGRETMRKKKWTIVAYPECDEGYLPRKEQIIYADNHDEAMRIAWRSFPEYHEVGAYEMD